MTSLYGRYLADRCLSRTSNQDGLASRPSYFFRSHIPRRRQPLRAATSAEIPLGNCSSPIHTRPSQLRLGNMRTTCGSRVRRSLFDIFLIDEESSTYSGINITENITQAERSNEPNPLNIGSPTRARTWGLRINSPSIQRSK